MLVVNNQTTIFEDLKVANMVKNNRLAKSILDVSWSSLKDKTVYKAESAGRTVAFVAPHYTSQECSVCHYVDSNNRLTQKNFVCLSCGHTENADINAAKTIKHRYIKQLLADGSTDSINLRRDSASTLEKPKQARLMKRKEAPAIVLGA